MLRRNAPLNKKHNMPISCLLLYFGANIDKSVINNAN